jgi:RNA polymerase sigma factor (sigma-70 family)
MIARTRTGRVSLSPRRDRQAGIVEPLLGHDNSDSGAGDSWPVDSPSSPLTMRDVSQRSDLGCEMDEPRGESGCRHRNPGRGLSASVTHETLLARLARSGVQDQGAWSEFVDRYGRKIYGWCLRWRLQHADAQDVTQIVLLKLAQRMKDFTYDPNRSFRAWLKTVAHHAWQDFAASRKTAPLATDEDSTEERLDSIVARDDLSRELEEVYDLELLETAMQRVRLRAAPHTWRAFAMTAVEGIPAPEVARHLGMEVARVYAARCNIQRRLQEECRRLESVEVVS